MKSYIKERLEKRLEDKDFKREWEDTSEEHRKILNEVRLGLLLSKAKEENRHEEVYFGTMGKELI